MTRGTCNYCNKLYSKTGMTKHVGSCEQRKAIVKKKTGTQKRHFYIVVQDRYGADYWMHLKVSERGTLTTLDEFLRDVWVECCGHLSCFTIEDNRYSSYPDGEFTEESMDCQLGEVLDVGMKVLYEYDFGSTTELILNVVGEILEAPKGNPIQIMARNEAPVHKCSVCGAQATEICCECIDEDKGWLCDTCASKHECGEDMLLPVVNSPRMGVCGYAGSTSEKKYSSV